MADASIPSAPCGIYGIFGPKGRAYIGQSIDIRKRFRQHRAKLARGTHPSPMLLHAWAKHGESAFSFEILAEFPKDSDLLTLGEQEFMDFHRARGGLYNTAPAAGSQLGFKHKAETKERLSKQHSGNKNALGYRHTEEFRERMKAFQAGKQWGLGRTLSPDHKAALHRGGGEANRTRVWTDEMRAKVSAAHKGREPSAEARARMSAAGKGRQKSEEHKAKISAARLRYFAERRAKNN